MYARIRRALVKADTCNGSAHIRTETNAQLAALASPESTTDGVSLGDQIEHGQESLRLLLSAAVGAKYTEESAVTAVPPAVEPLEVAGGKLLVT